MERDMAGLLENLDELIEENSAPSRGSISGATRAAGSRRARTVRSGA